MEKKYTQKSARQELAREIAREAMVLLKNEDNILPLAKEQVVAIIGQTQIDTIIGGGGSGASYSEDVLYIRDEILASGVIPETTMNSFYQELDRKRKEEGIKNGADFSAIDFEGLVASGVIYEIFGKYNPPAAEVLPEEKLFTLSASNTETAICIIGRASGGEECERRVKDDYYLTPSEKEMIDTTCSSYKNVIVIFNINGLVDMGWMNKYPAIKAAILMGTSGEQAAGALADILVGKVSPSGKLAQTVAPSYEAYPSAKNMTYDKDNLESTLTYESYGLSAEENGSLGHDISPVTVYEEDIYVGYRYFDSFEQEVQYPFGYGLSYAAFTWSVTNSCLENGKFTVSMDVQNTSENFAGKETIQIYVHAPFGKLQKPYQELKAFVKTKCLKSGETQSVTAEFALQDLASFDEASGTYIIESGEYIVLAGNSSQHTVVAAKINVPETIVTRTVQTDIGIIAANKDKIKLLQPEKELSVKNEWTEDSNNVQCYVLTQESLVINWPVYHSYDFSVPAVESLLEDVKNGKVSMEAFINQMSVQELAVLCNGYGSGLPFMGMGQKAPLTITYEDGTDIGYNSHPKALLGYCNRSCLSHDS